jgi:DNA-binding NarL/FixJ family response regulator
MTLQQAAGTGKSVRVLVVDDYRPWQVFVSITLRNVPELEIVGRVSDGLEAVQQAQQLQPDLILLDIGLPTLNGIAAARRIREVSPASKILFVSEDRSAEIAEEALSTGAGGYVVKSDAARELLPAVKAVLEGNRFVSVSLAEHGLSGPPLQYTGDHPHRDNVARFAQSQNAAITRHHEVVFCTSDGHFIDDVTRFIGTALKGGSAAIVVATESHREGLLPGLQMYGIDMTTAIEQGRYIALDAADALSTFMINGMPDPARFLNLFGNLIVTAARAANGEQARVAVFGEGVHLLWARGNAEAAIRVESLTDQIPKTYDVDILCGYSLGSVQGGMESHIFQRICAEHSAVHSR